MTTRRFLTRFQTFALLGFCLLMLADLTISSWGVLFSPVFTEANAIFAGFVEQPLEFIAVVGLSKLSSLPVLLPPPSGSTGEKGQETIGTEGTSSAPRHWSAWRP